MCNPFLLAMMLALLFYPQRATDFDAPVPVTIDGEIAIVPTEVVKPIPRKNPTEVVKPWTDEEVKILAQMLYGECRGVKSVTEQAGCVWCVLNRCDAYGKSVIEVVTAPNQFQGYNPDHPVLEDLAALSEDVLSRWYREKNGEESVGRVLPADYLYFRGTGRHNLFSVVYKGFEVWDWSLPSPYES